MINMDEIKQENNVVAEETTKEAADAIVDAIFDNNSAEESVEEATDTEETSILDVTEDAEEEIEEVENEYNDDEVDENVDDKVEELDFVQEHEKVPVTLNVESVEEHESPIDVEEPMTEDGVDPLERPNPLAENYDPGELEPKPKKEFKSIDQALSDLGSAEMKEEEEEFTPEDIRSGINSSPVFMMEAAESDKRDGEQKPEFEISDESVLQLLKVVNRIKARENFNIYNELPEEVKKMVDKYMQANGMGGFSVQSNTVRNGICRSLMEEFISTVSMEKTMNDFNKEMETLFNNVGKEFSSIYKDYDQERDKYLKSLLEKVPEDDPKRQKLINVMDAIYDAYKLERIKEFAKTMKPFKSIEIEKPEQRVFSVFERKYEDSQHNIYPLSMVVGVLDKYNPTNTKNGNLLFALTFARCCAKYDPENVEEHAFMYYTIYNIILLDIYKGEDFDNYAPDLITAVNEIIDIVAAKQEAKLANQHKK